MIKQLHRYRPAATRTFLQVICPWIGHNWLIISPSDARYNSYAAKEKETQEESRLLTYLMENYDREVRPVYNASHAVEVKVGITLTQIFDMVSWWLEIIIKIKEIIRVLDYISNKSSNATWKYFFLHPSFLSSKLSQTSYWIHAINWKIEIKRIGFNILAKLNFNIVRLRSTICHLLTWQRYLQRLYK